MGVRDLDALEELLGAHRAQHVVHVGQGVGRRPLLGADHDLVEVGVHDDGAETLQLRDQLGGGHRERHGQYSSPVRVKNTSLVCPRGKLERSIWLRE